MRPALPEFICNTSPLQYLHQIGRFGVLPKLTGGVVVPPPVVGELAEGLARGWNLPDARALPWIVVREPTSASALPLAGDLGGGEAGVLALALERRDAVGRRVAELLHIRLTGTLGLLLDAKSKGLISAVGPCLDELARLRFRVPRTTRQAALKLAGEEHELPPL